MPIFEYRCCACREEFETLVLGSSAPSRLSLVRQRGAGESLVDIVRELRQHAKTRVPGHPGQESSAQKGSRPRGSEADRVARSGSRRLAQSYHRRGDRDDPQLPERANLEDDGVAA